MNGWVAAGAADALAAGEASFEHVAALAAINDRLPGGAAQSMLALAAQLPPDRFARALQRVALPVAEVADASTGTTDRGGRWFRFGYNPDGQLIHQRNNRWQQ